MSGVSLPVSRPSGRALIVAAPAARGELTQAVQRQGCSTFEVDDPYRAMAELCRRPLAYRAVVLSLNGLYRDELPVIAAIKRRFAHLEIWLSHTDGRQAALAEAMRQGADGLLADDGLHRIAVATPAETARAATGATLGPTPPPPAPPVPEPPLAADEDEADDGPAEPQPAPPPPHPSAADSGGYPAEGLTGEPILTADELRALLHEQPSSFPPGDGGEV